MGNSNEFRIRTRQIAIAIARAAQAGTPWPAAVYEEPHGLSGTPAIDAARFATELRALIQEHTEESVAQSDSIRDLLRMARMVVIALRSEASEPIWGRIGQAARLRDLAEYVEERIGGLFDVERHASAGERILREEQTP